MSFTAANQHRRCHKRSTFRSRVDSLPPLQYDGVSTPGAPQPRVAVRIRYDLIRCRGRVSAEDPSRTAVLERTTESRDAACPTASLADVASIDSAAALLWPELARIGVRRGRRKGIAKKVACCALSAAAEAEGEEEAPLCRRGESSTTSVVIIIPIVVELLRARSTWHCDECLREGERKSSIKMILVPKGISDCDDDDRRRICAVCLEGFGGRSVSLPCSHEFHAKCIIGWLMCSSSCPLCRSQMPI